MLLRKQGRENTFIIVYYTYRNKSVYDGAMQCKPGLLKGQLCFLIAYQDDSK